jgi:tRNA threonylcarbamoyladenosine biosynthesis protein TsaB
MMILALEFSSAQRTAALVRRTGQGAPELLGDASDQGLRTCRPLRLVESVLEQARVELASVERLVVGLGPGSYAGIRSAIALAEGWQLARETPVAGLSSVECLAAVAQKRGWLGRVHIAINAQRGEFYLASYELRADCRQVLTPLRLASANEVRSLGLEPGSLLVGPGIPQDLEAGKNLFPDAPTLAELVDLNGPLARGEELEPIYLRTPSFVKAPPSKRYD